MNRRNNTPLSEYQRGIIKFLHRKGKSPKEIAEEEDRRREDGTPINVRTVRYWIQRVESTGQVAVKKRTGRPKALTAEQERKLIDYIKKNEKASYSKAKRKRRLTWVTRKTVNNYALRHKIKAYRAITKPPLSAGNKRERLDFAEYLLDHPSLFKIKITILVLWKYHMALRFFRSQIFP